MGCPTTTYLKTPLIDGGTANSEPASDRTLQNSASQYNGKRFRNGVRSACKYGDNYGFVNAAPNLVVVVPPCGVPCQTYYGLHTPLVRDAVLVTPQLYFPTHPDFRGDMDQIEQGLRGIKLKGQSDAALMAHADASIPAPPSTPSSTTTDTDLSSPQSFVSMHLAGSEASSTLGKRESDSRQRANSGGSFYRTKPCKFFHGNGTCVKGNKCNFIHDQNQARHPSQSPDVSSSSMSRRRRAAKRAQAKAEEAEKRSNYYPITWRVIGGGVMMGGQREVCQASLSGECSVGPDCKFSHPLQEDKELHGLPDAFSPSHYDSTKHFSRISPVCLGHPVMHCQAPTPLPREMKVSASGSTIIEVQNIPGAESAVLDGSTLLPRRDVVEDDTNAPTADAPSTEYALPSARTIVRPVSTPPAMKVSTVSIVGLFQAETSW